MTTSVELADKIADALGVGGQTVRHHLRNLGERKLITYQGRGRHAAEMTALDAARLTIAVVGSPLVKDSIATLERFGSLERRWGRLGAHLRFAAAPASESGGDEAGPAPEEEERSAVKLEDFLALRIDRLRYGYPSRQDRYLPGPSTRWSDRLAVGALELCGGTAPADPRAFAVVRWRAPSGRAERADFCRPSAPVEHTADFFIHHPDIPMLSARYVSAHAFERIARAF